MQKASLVLDSAARQTGRALVGGAAVGLPAGILGSLLARKMELDIEPTTQQASMPMARPPVAAPKKHKVKRAFTPTVSHVTGAGVAGLGGYKVLNKLLQRKDQRKLDTDLAHRERTFNDLLLHEQAVAGGFGKASAMLLRVKKANDVVYALEKLASDAYEKQAAETFMNTPISDVIGRALKALQIQPSGWTIAGPSALTGAALGFSKTREADPNVQKARAVKDSLKERLTGRDNMVGPMPIRVESDKPVMRPLRSGGASLVDPTKGRDVLEGI